MFTNLRPGLALAPVAALGVAVFSAFWCVSYALVPHLRALLDDHDMEVPPYTGTVRTIWRGVTNIIN